MDEHISLEIFILLFPVYQCTIYKITRCIKLVLKLREGNRLRVCSETKCPGKYLSPTQRNKSEGWRKLHSEDLQNL